jgi:cyanate permease
VAEALAPVLVGRLRDVTGSYVSGFSTLIGFALAGAIAIAFLPRVSQPSAPAIATEPDLA